MRQQFERGDHAVGILGSGLMGGKRGTLFARAGHDVVLSYARNTEKLKRPAKDAKGRAHVLALPGLVELKPLGVSTLPCGSVEIERSRP